MQYTYKFKIECVEMFQNGVWPVTPDGINEHGFRVMVREWAHKVEIHGTDILRHKTLSKKWSADQKLQIVSKVLAGQSMRGVAVEEGISYGMLYGWVKKYEAEGYNGLIPQKKGKQSLSTRMNKNTISKPLSETEREELIRLRAEVEFITVENEVIKKEIALREEKEAARLKAKKQRLSKNSEKKDTN